MADIMLKSLSSLTKIRSEMSSDYRIEDLIHWFLTNEVMRVHDFKTWYNTIQNSISAFEIKEFLSVISSAIFEDWSLQKSIFIKHDQLDKISFYLCEIFFFFFLNLSNIWKKNLKN